MISWKKLLALGFAAAIAIGGGACSDRKKGAAGEGGEGGGGGVIEIDGSSTVFPINQVVAEEYRAEHGGQITIGVSGTGGGFKKFCREELSITGASRPIKESERKQCEQAGVEFIELPVAYDGLAVVVHPDNDWVDHLTVEELETTWKPKSDIEKWSQVREGWPDEDIHFFAPGTDSGTFDYFTEAIVGDEGAARADKIESEDDNVLVQGVSTEKYALGFFGYAYLDENRDKLEVVPIDDGKPDNGKGPIAPSIETVKNSTYQPLSRPLFIYVAADAAEEQHIQQFVHFYLNEGRPLVEEVGYIPLPDEAYELVEKRFDERTTGSLFEGGSKVGVSVEELLTSGS